MSGALLPTLSLAAAALAGVIVVELSSNASSPQAVRTPRDAAAPFLRQPADPAAEVAALLARPLFAPDRKAEAVAGADDPRLPHLTGILVTREDRRAIFAGRGDGRGLVVGPGDQVGAYRVQTIEAAAVTLTGADGPHVVRPTFSASAPPVPAMPGTMPPLQLPPPPSLPGVPVAAGPGGAR